MMSEREAPFSYSRIDQTQGAFRLIRFVDNEPGQIECELIDAVFDDDDALIPYEALSYTWGGTEKKHLIQLNGQNFAVTQNLHDALRDLCRDPNRILWVDAICINQDDDKERTHQVQQMSRIYARAERVIVWLGVRVDADLAALMHSLEALEKASSKARCKSWQRNDPRWRTMWLEDVKTGRHADEAIMAQYHSGAQSLWTSPWFNRVWILQEAAFAQKAEIRCDGVAVSSRIFVLLPQLLGRQRDPHLQAVLDLLPSPYKKINWWADNSNRNLFSLLNRFRRSAATDPRDLIFALLGMCSEENKLLAVDYNLSMGEVLVLVEGALFQSDNSGHESSPWIADFLPSRRVETVHDLLLHLQPLACAYLARKMMSIKRQPPNLQFRLRVDNDQDARLKVTKDILLRAICQTGHDPQPKLIQYLLDMGQEPILIELDLIEQLQLVISSRFDFSEDHAEHSSAYKSCLSSHGKWCCVRCDAEWQTLVRQRARKPDVALNKNHARTALNLLSQSDRVVVGTKQDRRRIEEILERPSGWHELLKLILRRACYEIRITDRMLFATMIMDATIGYRTYCLYTSGQSNTKAVYSKRLLGMSMETFRRFRRRLFDISTGPDLWEDLFEYFRWLATLDPFD